ncbi:MAG: hypothetical protein JW789_05380 [Candidatus Aenigmarchaeota archaeon]|nr:hypothetical protein [Candidatus Aenigmarchaeota archaeon]
MDDLRVNYLVKEGKLRRRDVDKKRIASLIQSSIETANYVEEMALKNESATVIFRELYECLRQIGDALWWKNGYEVMGSHEISLEILQNVDVKDKVNLHKLDWFRRTRNNINYRGYKTSIEEAKEIVNFWKLIGKDLINTVKIS